MDETTEALFSEVRAKLQAKDAAGAMHQVWPYVSAHPEDGRGRSLYGLALCMSGHEKEGIAELKNACTLMPTDAQARYNLAVALHQNGQTALAKEELNRALQIDPNHASSIAMLEKLQNAPAEIVMTQPVDYASQMPLYGNPQPTVNQGQSGMQFQPAATTITSLFVRCFLGIGWGAAYAQYWTLWTNVWFIVLNISSSSLTDLVYNCLFYAVACTVMGSLVGMVVFLLRGNRQTGMIAGVSGGILLLIGEVFFFHDTSVLINALFWYFTGRLVGYRIGLKSERTP